MPCFVSSSSAVPPRWPRKHIGNGTWCSQTKSVPAGRGTSDSGSPCGEEYVSERALMGRDSVVLQLLQYVGPRKDPTTHRNLPIVRPEDWELLSYAPMKIPPGLPSNLIAVASRSSNALPDTKANKRGSPVSSFLYRRRSIR